MNRSSRPLSHPTQLALFRPDEADYFDDGAPPGLSPASPFLDFAEDFALPWLAEHDASPLTIQEYRESAWIFAALAGNPALNQTGAVPFRQFKEAMKKLPARRPRRPESARPAASTDVAARTRVFEAYRNHLWQCIDPRQRSEESEEDFAARVEWLSRQPKLAQNTRRKHCVTINRLLSLAGPPQKADDEAADLLTRPPQMVVPERVVNDNVAIYSAEEWTAWLDACKLATVPTAAYTGFAPSLWWSCLLPFVAASGVRIGTALQVRWEWIHEQWLCVPPTGIKQRRGRPIYLNKKALAAIEPLRKPGQATVFAWPYPWPRGSSWFDRACRRLQGLAGLPKERWLGIHAVRANCGTALMLKNPAVARMQLGHGRMMTTLEHYTANKIMAEVLEDED